MKNHYAIGRRWLFSELVFCVSFLAASATFAQTTEFTYQGKFPETGGTASGNYQMEFRLFEAATAGAQIGATISLPSVPVTKSVFSVNLDFGVTAFPGADRFLEVTTRKTSNEPFTLLGPRQKITSAPYSIKSKSAETASLATAAITADSATRATTAVNALQLGGLGANRYVRFDDNDNVGIGTISTGSKLAVAGTIESKSGGIKFPDATTQTTAGITSVNTDATLSGNGSAASPLGVASPLMVRDLDNPARQPFSADGSANPEAILVTVPTGKRLVIEFVTARFFHEATLWAGLELRIFSAGGFEVSEFDIAPSSSQPYFGQTHFIVHLTHSVRIYVEPGQQLRALVNGSSTGVVSVSGYWVDVP